LFDVSKQLVASVQKANSLDIEKQFKEVMAKNKISSYHGDCFYSYPKYIKSSRDIILKSMVSNSNGKKIYNHFISSTFGRIFPAMLLKNRTILARTQSKSKKNLAKDTKKRVLQAISKPKIVKSKLKISTGYIGVNFSKDNSDPS